MKHRTTICIAIAIVPFVIWGVILQVARTRPHVKWSQDGLMGFAASVALPKERTDDMLFEVVLRSAAVDAHAREHESGTVLLPSKDAADYEDVPFIRIDDPSPVMDFGVQLVRIPAWYSRPTEIALVVSAQNVEFVRRLRGDRLMAHFSTIKGGWS